MSVPLATLLDSAPYLADLAGRHADWLAAARRQGADAAFAALLAGIAEAGRIVPEQPVLATILRRDKQRGALLAAIAETGGDWSTARCTEALSDLADAALEAALDFLMRDVAARGKLAGQRPATAAGSGLALFALGKHGGRELNYSSDIDIVAFFDPEAGVLAEPEEATRTYTRIVQRLAALMDEQGPEGYVFRTDLRLRPDPGSTPLAISVDAALTYYEARGQNWERAAWIKARPCAGDRQVGEAFLRELAPYVWRKHLDFATIADIQAMKRQINITKNVGGIRVEGHNVKLGRGGIREIEFFTQTQQLIAGGRDASLRARSTAGALQALGAANWISPVAAEELTATYWFLRAVENRLQMRRDEQTHLMPETPEGVAIVARMMGEPDLGRFEARYRTALTTTAGYYAQLFIEGETLGAAEGDLVFTGSDDDPGTLETLSRIGFADPKRASATIRRWHYGGYGATRSAAARAHLTELLPALLKSFADAGNPDDTLTRFDSFLSRLPAGVQLFALLRNHAQLRRLLITFMAAAPRMAEAVIRRAHVMDGLIDPAFGNDIARPEVMAARVDAFLGEARDYQEVIGRARIIGQEQMFLVGAGILSGSLSARRAGAQLTALAETLLGHLFAAVRREFARRHGVVPGARAALLGFGKMASREMTVTSDLDFILLYESLAPDAESDGEKPLPASQYFTRLTQRLIAAIAAPTAEGVLYEADMRLRPSGNAGPLATSLTGFVDYHANHAWTWEALALSRARVIGADDGLAGKIDAAIRAEMHRPRDAGRTIDDVVAMRALMASERPPRHALDLKLAPGGLVDLEFIAQSAQILFAERIDRPQAPTAPVLQRLDETGLLPGGARLAEIHGVYSTVLQVMSAALLNPFKPEVWTPGFRELLAALTNYPSFESLEADLAAMEAEVQAAAERWYGAARTGAAP